MINDIDIPTMFKRDAKTHLVIPEMAVGCEWAQERTDTLLTIKLDGELIKVEWDVSTATKKVFRKLGTSWFIVDGTHPADTHIWEAYLNSSAIYPLPAGIYVAFGPMIQGNKQKVSAHQMLRIAPIDAALMVGWTAVDIHRGPLATTKGFYDEVKKELEESTVEGFIFQWEKPQMHPFKFAKVTRKDFGFSWPVVGVDKTEEFFTPSELAEIQNDPYTYVGD